MEDSLTSSAPPDRVHYATGVLLAADDFLDEQDYHRGRLARTLAYLHGSGTVAGLRVEHHPAVEATDEAPAREEELMVKAGLAIDRLGRLVEVPRDACIRPDKLFLISRCTYQIYRILISVRQYSLRKIILIISFFCFEQDLLLGVNCAGFPNLRIEDYHEHF